MPEVDIPGVGIVNFPYDMPPEQIAAQAQRLFAEAQGKDAPLTRERQPAGAPSALEAGHHPDTLAREVFGKRLPGIQEALQHVETPSDAAFLKRGPEVGGAAGMAIGGPAGAAVGAGLGSLVKGQHAQGAHVPTGDELTSAGGEALLSGVLAGAPGVVARTGRALGPTITKNAAPISRGIGAVTGGGAWLASGNPLAALGAGALAASGGTKAAVRGAGKLATRIGTMPSHATSKLGYGALSAEAFRKALLDALAEEPASTVP